MPIGTGLCRVLIGAYRDQEGNKLMFLSEWREFLSAPGLAVENLMTACVSMLLKSRSSLTCFRVCFFLVRLRTYQLRGIEREAVNVS